LHKTQKDIENNPQENKEWNQNMGYIPHMGHKIKTITKLFKDANINIANKTHNTTEHILWPKLPPYNIYNSGIYQLSCLECPKQYTGQTGRRNTTRNMSIPKEVNNPTLDNPDKY
jgi:hypothetical protein